MTSQFFSDSIFWVEIEKVQPNPFQPRKEFEEAKLRDFADSIRQYGILQPLVVTRKEIQKPEGGLATEYELISGERRLRASKFAGLSQVPVLIRNSEETDQIKA
jgi:ParB family chromosome partitioning protein